MSIDTSQQRPDIKDIEDIKDIDVPLDRDRFLRNLLRGLAGTLEDNVGIEEAAGFISLVGLQIGNQFDRDYRAALGNVARIRREQIGAVLVDLKRRIGGDFYLIEQDENKIVFGNRRCPFGEQVLGRPSLCMMTSNIFGVIAAESAGYARVHLDETIAGDASGCRVVVYLKPPDEADAPEPADAAEIEHIDEGREYFRGTHYDSDEFVGSDFLDLADDSDR